MEYSELVEKVKSLPRPPVYRNSTEVCNINGVPLHMWDVVTAAVVSGLNSLLLGRKGEGKSQLVEDVNNAYFNGRATPIRAHPDLKVKDIYTALNLRKLSSGKGTTKDAVEITDAVRSPLTIFEEINRAPPITQNQALPIWDGFYTSEEQNRNIFFGVDGYHIGIATGNVGKNYHGTFPFDDAYLDRSHLIINFNNFPSTELDLLEIAQGKADPRLISQSKGDHLSTILDIWKGMDTLTLSLDAVIADLYLRLGLDYCERSQTSRKTSVEDNIPQLCKGCHRLGDGCGYIAPTSTRAFKAYKKLVFGLKLVADAKSGTVATERPGYRDVFEAFKLTAPYSGMLDPQWVAKEHNKNPYFASEVFYEKMVKTFEERIDYFKRALSNSMQGNLKEEDIEVLGPEFDWLGKIFGQINSSVKEKGNLVKYLESAEASEISRVPALAYLDPKQTIFGDSMADIKFGTDIREKVRQKVRDMNGVLYATNDGIYKWCEGMRAPQRIFTLEQRRFGKKEISDIILLRDRLLFAVDGKIYDIENPKEPVENINGTKVRFAVPMGASLLCANNEGIWFSRNGTEKLEQLVSKTDGITAITSAPSYRLRKL